MRDADPALEDLIEFALVQQLGVPRLLRLELHGHFLAVGDVDRQVDVPEGAGPDLPHQLVFAPDDELGFGAAAARHAERRRWRLGPSPDTSEGRWRPLGLARGARWRAAAGGNRGPLPGSRGPDAADQSPVTVVSFREAAAWGSRGDQLRSLVSGRPSRPGSRGDVAVS